MQDRDSLLRAVIDRIVPPLARYGHNTGPDLDALVTDPNGRVWGHDNLVVCDGSVHPTNGGFNPVLTIMALAFRNATSLAAAI